jgi:hypothetical protein
MSKNTSKTPIPPVGPTPHHTEGPCRHSTRSIGTPSRKTKAELIRESQCNIKDEVSATRWLTKNELIIPGETTTMATLTMALLYISSGKYDQKEMINGIRAIAICHDSVLQQSKVNETMEKVTDELDTRLEAMKYKYIEAIEGSMSQALN